MAKDVVREKWHDKDLGTWRWRVTETVKGVSYVVEGEAESAFLAEEAAAKARPKRKKATPRAS